MNGIKENVMSRFDFHLTSKHGPPIPDKAGKELDSFNDAFEHARKLIDKILVHVGHHDAEAWKVVILNDDHDSQMIVPFSVSDQFRAQRPRTSR
jgi:hypothetical protein